jgi:hypothetical protein
MSRSWIALLSIFSATAVAQEQPALTPEEQAEIERALAADAKPQPPPPPPAPGGGGVLQSLNPDLSFIADVAFAWFSEDEPLQTGGHDPAANGFTLQQLELALGKAVDPYFRLDGNLVFSQFGVEIEEIYATTLALPANLQLRVGQFLTSFGRINATHPHAWDFVDQPFPLGRVFGGEGNRGLGVELSWLTPLPWYVEISGSVTDASGEATARSFFGGGESEVETPLDLQATLVVEQFFPFSDDLSLLAGLSAATGPNATGHRNRTDVYGIDLYLKYRPISRAASTTVVTLQSELLYRRRQVPGDLLQDLGAYTQLAWRFSRRWTAAARWEWGAAATGQDGEVADDPLDPEWSQARHRLTTAVTFFPTEFSRVRLQGSADLPGWRDPIYAVMTAFEFSIGAHGAHAF